MLLQKISNFSILFIYLIFISNHQILCDDGDGNTGGNIASTDFRTEIRSDVRTEIRSDVRTDIRSDVRTEVGFETDTRSTFVNCCDLENCPEEDCIKCGNDYRFFSKNNKCLKCVGISSQKPYYCLNSEQKCEVKDKKGDSNLLINGTYEIVFSCTNERGETTLDLKKLGDICYQNQPPNTKINVGETEYKCLNFYYEININDFIYFNCLGENITCPPSYKYYDYNSKECLNSCKETANLTKKEENGESYINRCSDNCLNGEFKYQNNCYDNCPKEAKYYYRNPENSENIVNVKECLPRCNKNDYSIGYECFTECKGLIKVDLKNSIYSCENTTSCPNNYPYNYIKNEKTYCLKSCLDTNDSYFYQNEEEVRETTYIYQNSTMGLKLCVSNVTTEDGPFYIDIKSLKWVKDCKTSSSGPFRNTTHCLDACDKDDYFTNDEYECVKDCANAGRTSNSGDSGAEPVSEENKYLYLDFDTKTCYKECPKNLGRGYHNESTNYCQSCNNPKNINDLKPGEGYHEQNNYTCMSSCGEDYYHNNNDNICFLTKCINSQIYKYQPFDKKICYKSCSDITEGAYKYEANYICYEYSENITEEFYTTGKFYFYNNSGIIKYIDSTIEKSQKECLDLNLKYLKDKECVSECNETDYKILPTRDKLGVCLSNISSTLPLNNYSEYIYFNKTKIISNKCKFFKILDDSGNAILTLDENCVEKCPDEYQYEYINGTNKICNLTCNLFVYEENGRKKCIDTCDKFKMETSSEKKCVDKCMNSTNNSTYAFYDSDNNCLDSCIRDDAVDQFSFEPIYDHQMCIRNCSLNPSYPYYYENEKICLRECRDYYGSDKKCVENCSNGDYVHPGKICTSIPCPSNAPFYYLKNIDDDSEGKVKICVQNCAGNVDNYTYYNITIVTEGEETREEKQCVENCLAPFNLIYESRCYDICPEGLYENNTNCVSKCPYFFKNESGKLICVETCPEEGKKYYTTSKECVSECPDGENFIGENNQCLPSCKYDNQKEFYEKIGETNNYLCRQNCSGKVYIEGSKECIPNCEIDSNELYEYNGICYRSCIDNPAPYSTIDSNNKKVCSNECNSTQPYFENDKVCINECLNLPFNKIINDSNISDFKFCVRQCDLSSEYKFLNNITTNQGSEESYQLYCRQQCGQNQRYLESNYKCIEKCPEPYNFVKNDAEEVPKACLSACPPEMPYARKNEEKNEYNCSSVPCKEENFYYYLEDKICIEKCNDSLINDTICTKTCDIDGFPKLYNYTFETERKCVLDCKETKLNFTSKDGKCVKECEENDYYDEKDLICKFRCPNNKKIDGKICRDICNSTDSNNKYEDNGYCVENCSISGTGYIYHKEGEYQCLNYCPDNLYVENYECKVECSNQNPYMNEKNCLSVCPSTKKYYLENNKTCLADCPLNNSYYDDTSFECKNNCLAYIPNSNSKINAKKCLGESCTGDYNYYIKDGNQFICYNQCPQNYPFMNDSECLKECPEGKVTKPGEYVCIDWQTCNSEEYFVKYNSKECVAECGKNDIIYENKYCVDNCTIIQEKILKSPTPKLKLTYDNKCVDVCQGHSEENGDQTLCICKRLFYYDKTTGYKTCLNQDLTSCEREENYPILKVDQNECINYCDGILSLSEHECYNDNNYTCGKNETLTTLINGDRKCDCIDKFYFVEENERKVKKCLKENDECPSTYSYLIKETKECVESCNDKKIYGKTCVLECPTGTKAKNGNECSCEGKWYVSENYDVICTEECPSFKSIILVKDGETKETGECVSTCIGTGFDTIFNKTCVNNCDGESDRSQTSTQNEPLFKNIASNFCKCNGAWYYDINGNDICIDDCFGGSINFKYKITSTNRCVNSCPENYYIFNDECVLDCGNDKILDTEKKMCICKKFWKYDENESQNSKKKIICLDPNLDSCQDGFLLINNTNECFKGNECPQEYPVIYNKKCYARNDCPKDLNTYYDEINQKCSCIEKWYKDNFGKIICLPENVECPGNYKYLNKGTKECQESLNIIEDSNSPLLYVFNYELYSNCPINTKKDEEKKECICDPLLGYWYNNQTSGGKIFKICAQEECPDDKKYNIHKQKECLQSCPADYKFIYQNICYEKCPNLTEAIGDSNECQLKTVDNEIKLETLEQVMTENIVDLYKKSTNYIQNKSRSDTGPIPGQKIITPNATVEYYGVNKNNKGKSSNNIQSDVSYIDISECIDKIYSSNKMKEKDDIVILKFDVNKMPNNFLINPVEYKLINSRTGQELDASVCEHNSIKISYPVHDLINKFDKMMRNMRKLEYMKIDLTSNNRDSLREKLDKGKEIIVDYPDTDIFNIDSKIYTDICVAVEVDGKDLVLEDRVNYFYPQLSLCENNCTYNHTDFINERIFCDCSYKTEFDFDREYTSYFELNTNQIKNDQSGNSNIAVMKCLSNLKNPKSISKNGGFIYSLLILFIEFILLLIIAIYGIRVLSNKLQSKMKKNEESEKEESEKEEKDENEEKEEVSIMNTNAINKKTDENLKTSERNLNNPPKKKKENYGVEFIPQEYVFLFFNQGDKGVIKKVERDSLPFKTKLNTRILLEQKKNINYDNIKPRGPFHVEQNVLVIVDSMDDDINDYLDLDDDISQEQENNNNKNILRDFKNTFYKTKMSKKSKNSKNINEKDDFKINQKAKLYKRNKFDFSITDYDPSDENYSIYDIDEEEGSHEKGLIETMKSNQRLLKRDYDIVVKNKKPSFIEILITEIIDKIYITKILFFTRKFDIFSLQLSVYLLCHLILLVFNTLFFDVKTIKDIWAKESYPGLGYYLGYGFLACLIVWVIYKVFLCLLTNNDKIKEILKLIHFNKKYGMNKEIIVNKKYTNLIWKVKFKFSIYSFIEFLLLILGFLYLTVFCSVYTGTQSKIFKAYGIALIEILIIKILYGIALAIMRHISLSKQKKGLYKVVLFLDTYLV